MGALRGLVDLHHFFADHPLTSAAPRRAWLRFARWQLRSRLTDEVLIDWIRGQRLAVRRGMTGATGNIYVGLHEFPDMMTLLHFLRPNDLFLDVGANVGTYTVLAAGACGARTSAFEPDPDTVGRLRRNIEINRLGDRVRVQECAIGAGTGEARFTVGLDTVNRFSTAADEKTRLVRVRALDDAEPDSLPAMLKVDVEGAERDVLLGATVILGRTSLKVIELETADASSEALLARHGFVIAYYDPFSRTLTRTPGLWRSANRLFVRDWPFVADRLLHGRNVDVLGRSI